MNQVSAFTLIFSFHTSLTKNAIKNRYNIILEF